MPTARSIVADEADERSFEKIQPNPKQRRKQAMKEESKECQNAKVKFVSGLGPLSSYKICSHSQPPWVSKKPFG
ncbi:hypothetical protein T11_13670 [Trichinella zimbabwensis]|uniref:Uncharacterized protein n=1 Tax=Trichinella zimbabwensis TaxID=268475 RepID=A0A0V1I6F2_9BILA|nr:hypothetical protein T11_13670 [Trichinella zimbabwensis]